jgi:hypothetical protein
VIRYCPGCRTVLGEDIWKARDYHHPSPWPGRYTYWHGDCPNCHGSVQVAQRSNGEHCSWVGTNLMKQGEDYDLLFMNRKAQSQTSGAAVWLWHPLWEDAAYRELSVAAARGASLIILPPGVTNPGYSADEVWQLRPHMMMGANGPHASMRAEMGIGRTLFQRGTYKLSHVWPAAFLDPENYKPLSTDRQITLSWARHVRKNIEIEVE